MQKPLIILLVLVLSFILPLTARSQILTNDRLPGLKIDKESAYDGTSLYGYIDGGSTLYFEYGFDHLTVQELTFNQEKFTIEYWRMKSCQAAFGIYSINTFTCVASDQQGMIDCENQYQSQLFAGHHYISVVSTTGTKAAQSASAQLIRKLKEIIPAEEGLTLPEPILRSSDRLTGEVKFIRGELGLQNGLPDWSIYFEGLNGFELWIRQTQIDGKEIRKAIITFSSPADLATFVHNASLVPAGDGWTSPDNKNGRWMVTKRGEKKILVEIR
jgi:hypothetical protein